MSRREAPQQASSRPPKRADATPGHDHAAGPPRAPGAAERVWRGANCELRLGRWQDVLADVECDALVFDAPFGARTHASSPARADGHGAEGLAPAYGALTEADVREVCEAWRDRCRGWIVSITDSDLAPVWREELDRIGRLTFAPLGVLIPGMSVRMQGDGPSSWMLWVVVGRPRRHPYASWGTLPGGYTGSPSPDASGGRGKPRWLTDALVRDYTCTGDLVCDPFAGLGTTLASAVAYRRRAIGAECDESAYREAVRRLAQPTQVDLFAG